jgi:uncharacterized repeat protein (TIGR01451 family)
MKNKKWTVLVAVLGIVSMVWLTGCQCMKASEPKPAVKKIGGCPAITMKDGVTIVSQAFPTGEVHSSVLLVESTSPAEVMVGEAFTYTINATNLTDCPLDNVVIVEDFDSALQLQASDPQAQKAGNKATWNLGTIGPQETKTINAKLASKAAGEYTHCVTVDYLMRMCQSVVVVAPELKLTKSMPDSVLLCDQIPVKLAVSNTGTGTIKNVTVTDTLPGGLVTVDGKQTVTYNIPALESGQSENLSFAAKAEKTGTFKNTAVAKSAGGLSADASASVVVRQPVLTISKTATEQQFAGRMIDYKITVANKGDAPADKLVITDTLPAGASLVRASAGGQASGGTVTWNLGSLAPGKSASVALTAKASQVGVLENVANAAAECARPVMAKASTKVVGIPAVLLEVIDIEDPIEVGSSETYVITVTNQGSADDTNIKIVCTLEDSQGFVSAGGATAGKAAGQVVTFAPLPRLGAKQKASWKVTVKALKAGDIRFKVQMTTDQLGRPVEETEATNQY